MKIIGRFVVILLVSFLAINGSYAMGQFFFFENPLIGQKAPDFTLNSIYQKNLNLTAVRDGKPVIIFFWATWCPHCRVQLDMIHTNQAALKTKGIQVALVDLGESEKQVQSYMSVNNISMDVFLDEDASVSDAYGVIGIPTFILVNAEGIVRAVEHEIPEDYEQILFSSGASATEDNS
ncbi:MAG: TlpA disulfide reductase family protein [Candidatus Omnitrophota bacterium]|jgi:peroxiredoxin